MKAQKGFGVIGILGSVVIVLLVGIGGFYIVKDTDTEKVTSDGENSKTVSENQILEKPREENLVGLGPKEVYIKMKNEIEDTESLDEIIDVMLKYTTEEKKKEVEQSRQEAYKSPLGEQFIFSLYKKAFPSTDDIVDIREEIVGSIATLYPSTRNINQKGIVILKKEDGIWKVEKEDWQTNTVKKFEVNIEL